MAGSYDILGSIAPSVINSVDPIIDKLTAITPGTIYFSRGTAAVKAFSRGKLIEFFIRQIPDAPGIASAVLIVVPDSIPCGDPVRQPGTFFRRSFIFPAEAAAGFCASMFSDEFRYGGFVFISAVTEKQNSPNRITILVKNPDLRIDYNATTYPLINFNK
jgi:hypothetical protein